MVKSIYPGTFDPVTNGHLDIVRRASLLFEKVIVCVYSGSLKNVDVIPFNSLTVDLAKQLRASVIIRGLRIGADFEYEREMALTNREMNSDIDTVCLISSLKYQYVSSSRVKEIASLQGDIKSLVPEHVFEPLMKRISKSA